MTNGQIVTVDAEDLRQTLADTMDVDVQELRDDADFIEDVGVDSLMALEVLAVLEKKYGVRFVEQEMRELRTFTDAHRMLTIKLTES
ncbi:acyl carrier protein [Kibdelosporangium lantanae]|uniref:Acyl carrier protein n=1 Tax=Kibdelosporangium lantanae TaxID=1497396 RepID=A0ABW3MQ18_9PSEU